MGATSLDLSSPAASSFGARPRAPRPVLLTIVFGVLLAIVGVTASAQAVMVSIYASTSTLNSIIQSDVATVRGFVHQGLDDRILDPSTMPPEDREALESLIATLLTKGEILRVELRLPDGRVVAGSDPGISGTQVLPTADFSRAVESGQAQLALVDVGSADVAPGPALETANVLREYVPLSLGESVVLVVGVWRDAEPIIGQLDTLRRDVVIVTITAALIAAITLYFVFRGAQGRLTRQAEALIEAGRRDALTNTLNHGALVGLLAEEIERARREHRELAVALIDIDGFRLLNDNHGHRAGDEALLTVASLLATRRGEELLMGRYGPDEFLLVSKGYAAEDLEPLVGGIRAELSTHVLEFEATDPLPITISAGLCTYPTHGTSVTTLLSAAVRTLEEAKASGGDSIRIARPDEGGEQGVASSFDVLKGLVLAVDTKDRYTKRHSEDVARYALFLAGRIGLDDELLRTIQVSGLLHDVGKIGIPDEVLRKPGRLTADEMGVLQQHVALGDMIVRELPDIDTVRDGIRHHHERWDGKGYLAGLSGEEIPLIARVLAVADAFSAMTTTRPYRKALDVREALNRLGDAAGTQLDERLVTAFIEGIEHDVNAPLPGADTGIGQLWAPLRRAA
jgi:diguanylate cyclase (GGDEF)-like protein